MASQKSFRFDDDIAAHLAELASGRHEGSFTAAVTEAIERYYSAVYSSPAGWISVRFQGKKRCPKCRNEFEGPGFVSLLSTGTVLGEVCCSKCAK